MKKSIINVIRNLTRNLTFKRSLPNKFGNFSLYVMPRSNILTLNPFNSLAKIGHEELLAAADLLVEPGNVVWDIGANIGLFSVAAAYKTSQSGRVIAIEADDCHTQLLRKTLHLDEKASYVDVICAGVSDNNGITELNIVERGWEKNYIRESKGSGSMQTGSIISKKHIVTVTLDWLSNYFPPPDVLKIDIEGAEYMALNSGKHILKEKRPIIYIEIQDYNKYSVTNILKKFDYRFFIFKKDKHNKFFIKEMKHCAFNTIAIHEDRGEKIASLIR